MPHLTTRRGGGVAGDVKGVEGTQRARSTGLDFGLGPFTAGQVTTCRDLGPTCQLMT